MDNINCNDPQDTMVPKNLTLSTRRSLGALTVFLQTPKGLCYTFNEVQMCTTKRDPYLGG